MSEFVQGFHNLISKIRIEHPLLHENLDPLMDTQSFDFRFWKLNARNIFTYITNNKYQFNSEEIDIINSILREACERAKLQRLTIESFEQFISGSIGTYEDLDNLDNEL
jgi:hypothetical protein